MPVGVSVWVVMGGCVCVGGYGWVCLCGWLWVGVSVGGGGHPPVSVLPVSLVPTACPSSPSLLDVCSRLDQQVPAVLPVR